jgi:hypothetical protein
MQHGKAQVAIDAQSALSHGTAAGGQQSCIGSGADISVGSCGCSLNAAAPTAGSTATDTAMRTANMVRKTAICAYPISGGGSDIVK